MAVNPELWEVRTEHRQVVGESLPAQKDSLHYRNTTCEMNDCPVVLDVPNRELQSTEKATPLLVQAERTRTRNAASIIAVLRLIIFENSPGEPRNAR